jgi:DNA-binding transcriptional LysR family regulator
MSYSKYAVFLKVAELGSMSKAAMYCNYSQSAVSQIISSLEDELQMTLLNRNQSGVTLTSNGEQMLPYIRHLRDAAEAVSQQAAKLKGVEVGHIRIGTFSSVSCHVLAPVLKEFKTVYPNISIEIREGDDASVNAMLLRDEVDFGFMDAPVPAGFDSFLVRRDPFMAVVSENSPYAAAEKVSLSVYSSEPTALYDEGSQKEAMGIFRKNKITPRVEYTSRDDNLILSLIENDLCIGYMGQLILTKNSYRVVSRPTEPQYYRDIMFVVRSIENASPAAARFVEFFKKYLVQAAPQ